MTPTPFDSRIILLKQKDQHNRGMVVETLMHETGKRKHGLCIYRCIYIDATEHGCMRVGRYGGLFLLDDDRLMLPAPIVAHEGASPLRPERDCRLVHGARRCIRQIGSQRTKHSRNQSARFALESKPRHPCTKLELEQKSPTHTRTGLRSTSIGPECHEIAPHHRTAGPPFRLARCPGSRDGICSSGRTRIERPGERSGWAPGCSRSRSPPIRQSGWRGQRQREKGWRIRSR